MEKVFDRSELGYKDIYKQSDDTCVKSYVYEDKVGSTGDLIPRIHKEVEFVYKCKRIKTFIFRSQYDREMEEAVQYWMNRIDEDPVKGWDKMIRFFWPKDDGELF